MLYKVAMSKVEVCLEVEALLLLLGACLLETELVRVRVGGRGDLHKKLVKMCMKGFIMTQD